MESIYKELLEDDTFKDFSLEELEEILSYALDEEGE